MDQFVCISEKTNNGFNSSYARSCAYLNISGSLPKAIALESKDSTRTHVLDYEHDPFRCCKFHQHGHLFRGCPINASRLETHQASRPEEEGFTKVPSKKCHNGKFNATSSKKIQSTTRNIFEVLNELPEDQMDQDQEKTQPKASLLDPAPNPKGKCLM